MLNFASICPHPPIIIPTIGKENLKKVSKTIEAMKILSQKFEKADPETLIIISPHAPIAVDTFTLNKSPTLVGNFHNFGNFDTEFIFKNDLDLAKQIEKKVKQSKIPLRENDIKEIDHGALVPLYYLTKGKPNIKIVPLACSCLNLKKHFKFGQLLGEAIKEEEKKIGLVASGDLSHRLTKDAPAGYSPQAEKFDRKLIELLKKKDTKGILNIDSNLVQQAGECGYRPIIILLGVLSELKYEAKILSYQGPFGVGYLVAFFQLLT